MEKAKLGLADFKNLLRKINGGSESHEVLEAIETYIRNLCDSKSLEELANALSLLSETRGRFGDFNGSWITPKIAEMVSGIVGFDAVKRAAQEFYVDNRNKRSGAYDDIDDFERFIGIFRLEFLDFALFDVLARSVKNTIS